MNERKAWQSRTGRLAVMPGMLGDLAMSVETMTGCTLVYWKKNIGQSIFITWLTIVIYNCGIALLEILLLQMLHMYLILVSIKTFLLLKKCLPEVCNILISNTFCKFIHIFIPSLSPIYLLYCKSHILPISARFFYFEPHWMNRSHPIQNFWSSDWGTMSYQCTIPWYSTPITQYD